MLINAAGNEGWIFRRCADLGGNRLINLHLMVTKEAYKRSAPWRAVGAGDTA